jgi:hypothetical protein
MITIPHDNQILSRFNTAASLQASAHYFDMKATTTEQEKGLNKMLVDVLVKESKKMVELGLYELSHRVAE